MSAVETILGELKLRDVPVIMVFNKIDRFEDAAQARALCRQWEAIGVSALERSTLRPLTDKLMRYLKERPQVQREESEALFGELEVAVVGDEADTES